VGDSFRFLTLLNVQEQVIMDEFKEYFSAAAQCLAIFKQAKDLLPESKEKDDASVALNKSRIII